jgi:hypothetical protein
MMLILAAVAISTAIAGSQEAEKPQPQPANGVTLRGCLTGTKLTHVEPADPKLTVPGALRLTTIRVIRDQVKPLNGHQVEVIGTLRGVPDQETGVLVGDSGKAKVYIGGGDKNLGEDLTVTRNEPPTIHAQMIKDLAPSCPATPAK